jgi:hypothetical protein
MATLEEKKLETLRKFYGGERSPEMHDFRLEDGECKNCGTFIGDATMRLCKVITPDEVKLFRLINN